VAESNGRRGDEETDDEVDTEEAETRPRDEADDEGVGKPPSKRRKMSSSSSDDDSSGDDSDDEARLAADALTPPRLTNGATNGGPVEGTSGEPVGTPNGHVEEMETE